MARLLEPRDFGVVALAGSFVFFLNLFVAHSFGDVVVQRRQIEPEHLDTAFWSMLCLALALMALCQVSADGLALLLGEPALAETLRLLSLAVPLGAIGNVHLALCRRDMRFRAVAVRTLAGRVTGTAVGIAMAVAGFGLWSLVALQLVVTLVTAAGNLTGVAWWPRLRFSRRHLGEMLGFGLNVSTTQIVAGVSEQALNMLVGALFGSLALGYFTIAWRVVQLIRSLVSSAVYHVGLSAFARLQDDRAAMGLAFVQGTRIACLAGFPIAAGIALVSEPLLLVLFGAKWLPSVPLLAALALEMIPVFYGIFFSALYRATGRPGWSLTMALLNLAAGVAGVLAVAPMGMLAVAVFWVVRAVLLVPLHVMLVHRILGMPIHRLAAPIFVPAIATVAMAAIIVPLRLGLEAAGIGAWSELALLVPAGAIIYGMAVRLLSPELAALVMRTARVVRTPAGEAS
jgi:PST family polysaccharide transporter